MIVQFLVTVLKKTKQKLSESPVTDAKKKKKMSMYGGVKMCVKCVYLKLFV